MPEGDTLYRAAVRVGGALVGNTAQRVGGSHPALRPWKARLQGRAVKAVENSGKHLLIHFDGDLSIRTHLKMTGKWRVYRRGEKWTISEGKARVIVDAGDHVAVCFSAPDVEAGPTAALRESIAHLGPDLTADAFSREEAINRVRRLPAASAAELLLDQRGMAGIGNVYKSEILFLEKIHPDTDPSGLTDDQIAALVDRARKLFLYNRGRSTRNTTGYSRGANYWVYGRDRKPCRRCGTEIRVRELAERITYWCPGCQS